MVLFLTVLATFWKNIFFAPQKNESESAPLLTKKVSYRAEMSGKGLERARNHKSDALSLSFFVPLMSLISASSVPYQPLISPLSDKQKKSEIGNM